MELGAIKYDAFSKFKVNYSGKNKVNIAKFQVLK